MFNVLTFNLNNSAIRHETLHGKKYLVAPMAMLTEGVHSGSGGALLYQANECKKAVPAWNMKPVVVYHPEINGQGVSACDVDVLEKQQVGMVMNTRWDGKLRAEAWIDEELANKVDDRVIQALEENKIMEVSTGLFTENVGTAGEWNGEPYTAIATNHQPDHLALLPDKIGACSVADGAGLLQLNETATANNFNFDALFARQMDTMRRIVGNAMSHNNIYGMLTRAIRSKLNTDEVWIEDVYDEFFIYNVVSGNKLYRQNYTSTDTAVEFMGDPQEVIQVTEYRTVKGEFVGNGAPEANKEPVIMDKKKVVDGLIANTATAWVEDDRAVLMGMDETVLTKMAPVANAEEVDKKEEEPAKAEANAEAEADAPVANATPVPVTLEQYITNAPAEIQDVLRNGVKTHQEQKALLVGQIVANANNKFTEEFLNAKGLQELQGMAALAGTGEKPAADGVVPMFIGANTPGGVTANAAVAEEGLEMPRIDFSA